MDKPNPDHDSPWYAALALMTKRGKVVNEQDLPAPVRKLTQSEIDQLKYVPPKAIPERID